MQVQEPAHISPFLWHFKGHISRTSEKYTVNVQLVGLQIKE